MQLQVHVLRKAGLPAQNGDASKMISMLDKDHDGVISYQEFCRFCCLLPSAQVRFCSDSIRSKPRFFDKLRASHVTSTKC